MGDSLPWTPINRLAKFDAANFILGGEIRNRTYTKKQTNKQTANDISTPCLSACVDNNCITCGLAALSSWSVYRTSIGTNNDCEGWHARLNRTAVGVQLPIYTLIDLLRDKSKLLAVTTKLLSVHKALRLQRKSTQTMQHRIFALWDEFDARNRSANG